MRSAIAGKLKTYARELRAEATDVEQRVWFLLRDRRFFGFKFRRQHPVAGFILDFYCAEAQLALELDGGQHALDAGADRLRDAVLGKQGIRVLRFWNNEFLQNTEGALVVLANALEVVLEDCPSPPTPLPIAWGEGSSPPSPRLRGEGRGEGQPANNSSPKVGAGEPTKQQGGRAKDALLAVANGDTAPC